MWYSCNVVARTRIRTAPNTLPDSQTNEYFDPGDHFIAQEVIAVRPGLEEWLKFVDSATGRILYTAAIYPHTDGSPERFVNYEAVDTGPLFVTKIIQVFVYKDPEGTELDYIDITEWLSDGSSSTKKFKALPDET